jgi:hypothetical protein
MNQLERDIKEAFHRHEGDAPSSHRSDARRAVKRAHRRQVLNAGGIAVGAAAIFLAAVLIWPTVQQDVSQPAVPAIPSVVRITCDGMTARAESRSVAAQPDGIHIELAQSPGQRATNVFFYDSRNRGNSGFGLMGRTSPAAPREVTLGDPTSIGWLTIACTRRDTGRGLHHPLDWAGVEVVDPAGLWTSAEVDCGGEHLDYTRVGDFSLPRSVDVRGMAPQELADVLLQYTPELRPGDVVEEAGFPRDGISTLVAVRDGDVVARFGPVRPGPRRTYYGTCLPDPS